MQPRPIVYRRGDIIPSYRAVVSDDTVKLWWAFG